MNKSIHTVDCDLHSASTWASYVSIRIPKPNQGQPRTASCNHSALFSKIEIARQELLPPEIIKHAFSKTETMVNLALADEAICRLLSLSPSSLDSRETDEHNLWKKIVI